MPIVVDPPVSPPPAPPADDGSALWEILYEALGYHQVRDPENEYALRTFCEGWCAPLQRLHDLERERPDAAAWEVLFDPDRCPAESLPYLAQFVGVVVTPEMGEQQIRDEIGQPTGWRRGETESIRVAARRPLKPVVDGEELMVIIRPRTPEVGRHYIRTLLAQTPEPLRAGQVIREATPAWEVLDYDAIEGVTFADITASYETFGDLAGAFPDFRDLAEVLPDELPEP